MNSKLTALSFLLYLSSCSFDGSGWGNNPTITEAGSESSAEIPLPNTTGEDDPTTSSTSINLNITSSTTDQTTGIEGSTTEFDTTGSIGTTTTETTSSTTEDSTSSTSEDVTTGEPPIELCGNCELERNEECDSCVYGADQTQSFCATVDDPEFEKCTIGFYKLLGFAINYTSLKGMLTPQYDQEEADILCKIFLHSINAKATNFNINMGYSPQASFISTTNIQNKGILLKSATEYYNAGPLYFYEYDDIPGNQNLDQVFYSFSCKIV